MKTLLVRPGIEIKEKTLRGPWAQNLSHLEKMYSDTYSFFRGLVIPQATPLCAILAVGTVLEGLDEDVECLEVPLEFGIPLTEGRNERRKERIEGYIAGGGYNIVGISCTGSIDCIASQIVAEAAKKALDDVIVVFGGYEATADPFDLMEKIQAIDVIVLGDFEPIAEQLYASFNGEISLKTVPNLIYRENGRVCASKRKHFKIQPEDLPIYDYSLVKKYIPKYAWYYLETSRGCLYNCTFCQEKVVRKSYIVKDVAVAADELINTANYIAQFVDSLVFNYADPLWGANSAWVKEFCSQLIERRDEIKSDAFGWVMEGRIGQFDDEALSLLKKAGCITVGYGVESLSPKMLRIMNKTKDPQKYITSALDTVQKTLKENLHATLAFVLGMPGETKSTLEETMNLIRKLPLGNEKLHFKLGVPLVYTGSLLDKQLHDPQFVEKYGVRILDENDWEKAYIPRLTLLFDPSRELSAAEMTDIFINFLHEIYPRTALGEERSEGGGFLDKKEISADTLSILAALFRKTIERYSLKEQ